MARRCLARRWRSNASDSEINVTEWLSSHPKCKPTEFVVTQSSDAAFHCITITVFYKTA